MNCLLPSLGWTTTTPFTSIFTCFHHRVQHEKSRFYLALQIYFSFFFHDCYNHSPKIISHQFICTSSAEELISLYHLSSYANNLYQNGWNFAFRTTKTTTFWFISKPFANKTIWIRITWSPSFCVFAFVFRMSSRTSIGRLSRKGVSSSFLLYVGASNIHICIKKLFPRVDCCIYSLFAQQLLRNQWVHIVWAL